MCRSRLLSASLLAVVAGCAILPPAARARMDAALWQSGTIDLNGGWLVHNGDNVAWAQSNFDDSGWPAIALTLKNNDVGWRWYRLCTEIPPGAGPLALLITGGDGTYEVYVNGQRLPGPRLLSEMFVTYPRSQVVPLPAVSGSAVSALRTRIPTTSLFLADRGAWQVQLGSASTIEVARRAAQSVRLNSVVLGTGISLLMFLAALGSLGLFWLQKNHREYFWLGSYLISVGAASICFELSRSGFLPFSGIRFSASLSPIGRRSRSLNSRSALWASG